MTDSLSDAEVTAVVQAAIKASMYEQGFDGDCQSGFSGIRSIYEGDLPEDIVITYPEGQILLFGQVADGADPGFDAATIYRRWEQLIPLVFFPWQSLPDPDELQSSIEPLRELTTRLAVGGHTQLAGEKSHARISVPDQRLTDLATYAHEEMGQYNGLAMETFDAQYARRLPEVFLGVQSLAAVTGTVVTGEQEIWRKTRDDVTTLATNAQQAFVKLTQGGAGNWHGALTVGTTVLSVAGLFATGGVSTAISAAGIAAGVVDHFLPDPPPPPPAPELPGDSAEAVYESLVTGLAKIGDTVAEQEGAYRDCATKAQETVNDTLGSFVLGLGPVDGLSKHHQDPFYSQGEHRSGEIDVLAPHLRDIAARFELLGEELENMKSTLGSPGSDLGWTRAGKIGIGPTGHYLAWTELFATLDHVLGANRREMHTVAEQLVQVSWDFQHTDEQVDEVLTRMAAKVKSVKTDPVSREHHPQF